MKRTTALLPFVIVAVGLGVIASGCSSSSSNSNGSEDNVTVDCSTGSIPSFASVDFSTCTSCHSSTLTGSARAGAPSSVNYDTFDAAKMSAADATSELAEGAMPPAGSPKPTQAVIEAIAKWSGCGTPQ